MLYFGKESYVAIIRLGPYEIDLVKDQSIKKKRKLQLKIEQFLINLDPTWKTHFLHAHFTGKIAIHFLLFKFCFQISAYTLTMGLRDLCIAKKIHLNKNTFEQKNFFKKIMLLRSQRRFSEGSFMKPQIFQRSLKFHCCTLDSLICIL